MKQLGAILFHPSARNILYSKLTINYEYTYYTKLALLSVQCNTLHGTEYKITCGLCLSVCLSVSVCDRTGFEAEYLENG